MSDYERSSDSQAFQRTWENLRAEGQIVPVRSTSDLIEFAKFLPQIVLAEADIENDTMPIRMAGSTIRDWLGLDLTGRDYLDLGEHSDDEHARRHRSNYHDIPCGRYEILDVSFASGLKMECLLTILPIWGHARERIFVVLAEVSVPSDLRPDDSVVKIADFVKYGATIDIGAGTL